MATNVQYNGTQGFILQPGGGVSYNGDGTATHTVIWRGPLHKLAAFRNSIPTTSPSFGGLKLSAPPSEFYEGAYARVVAQYGGQSKEVSGNFPNDIDQEDPTVPTVTLSLDFQVSSVVIGVVDGSVMGEFRLDYRAPVNTVNYTSSSKPSNVSGKSKSGITGEADPKILSVTSLDQGAEIIQNSYLGLEEDASAVKLLQTTLSDRWQVKTAAIAFRRQSNGQFWRVSETWTKLIVQANNDEDFDTA